MKNKILYTSNYNKKDKKGITLIALVITIIVLLILAGVTISTLTGENGIISNAITAKDTYEQKEIEEQIELAKYSLIEVEDKKASAENIKNYLVNNGFKPEDIEILPKDDDNEILKVGDYEFEVPIYKVTLYFEKGENWTRNEIYAYIWTDEGNEYKAYPGVKADLVDGTDNIYKYTVPEKYEGENIIFNNGLGSGINAMQTVDLKMAEDGYIFRNTDANSRTVYYRTTRDNMYIYIWNDDGDIKAWPGEQMIYYKTIETTLYYKFDIPQGYENFIFTQVGEDGTSKWKTLDLNFLGGNKIYRDTPRRSINIL